MKKALAKTEQTKEKSKNGKRRIAIACQGGGSQTAFTAGALRSLFEGGALEEFELVGLSGTSGGAVCATLAWYSLMLGDAKPWERVYAFWHENMASTKEEREFNKQGIETLRSINEGRMPSLAMSPSSPLMMMLLSMSTRNLRPLFTDFRGLLEKHIDFAEMNRWGARPQNTALVLGAANVLTGRLAKFCSTLEAIRVEHILASSAIPNLFPAVEIDGGAYWDGLFSDNPPISALTKPRFVGLHNIPHEIWVIKINPTTSETAPQSAEHISDRRNELVGNVSLFQQLESIAFVNNLALHGAFKPGFAREAGIDLDGPIYIPKCFTDDEDQPYHIPFLEMSPALATSLDSESKLDRDKDHVEALIADGEKQGREFLAHRRTMIEAAGRA